MSITKELDRIAFDIHNQVVEYMYEEIAKELNQPNAMNTQVGQIIWMTLDYQLGEERIGTELYNLIKNASKEEKVEKSFAPTAVEVTDASGNLVSGVQHWNAEKKKWQTITKTKWDSISKDAQQNIKSKFPDVYTLLITLE